jgi:DNA polymerase elongation subunit (family B)
MICPLVISLNKDKLIVGSNGELKAIPSPTLTVPMPASYDKRNSLERYNQSYYFIGRNKWSDTNGKTNQVEPAVKMQMDHMQWREGPGNNLPFSYTDYMLVTQKEELKKYAHNGPMKIMYWDIEVCSDGSGIFPKAYNRPVAMIGYKVVSYDGIEYTPITGIEILDDFRMENENEEDKQILIDFVEVFKKHDPDIIVGYNSWKFDMPYILERMEIMAIPAYDLAGISEDQCNSSKNIYSHFKHNTDKENTLMQGVFGKRIHYDIFLVDVIKDTKLTGMKRKSMKALAQRYYPNDKDIVVLEEEGIENILEMMRTDKGRSRLREYLNSDIVQTERLSEFYFGTDYSQAEELQVPLSTIINRRNGTIPSLYLLKELVENRMIPLNPNVWVFEELVTRAERTFGEKKFFQGAYVDIYKTGKMPYELFKIDFSSLYPNLIRTFNISYETVDYEFTPIEGEVDESVEAYSATNDGKQLIIQYNDAVLHVRAKITIDMTRRGLVPQIMDKILTNRKEVKGSMKSMDQNSVEYMQADAKQLFLKIVANSLYGILSQRTGIGFLPMGMTVTSMGRWSTKSVVLELNKQDNKLLFTEEDKKAEEAKNDKKEEKPEPSATNDLW